jgi:hypothetical protein
MLLVLWQRGSLAPLDHDGTSLALKTSLQTDPQV